MVITFVAEIDASRDGIFSEVEERTYSERVLRDLSLRVDGERLSLRLVSVAFPKPDDIREGFGETQIQLAPDLPRGGYRKLIF